jgi:hypothetical protein
MSVEYFRHDLLLVFGDLLYRIFIIMVPPLHCTLLQQEEDNQCDIPEWDTPQEMQKND